MSRFSQSPITAVLGPTNTGKTHLAVERMLGHSSGMMGFPLRLLAREVYDRVVAAKGAASVALVTGEERIWPQTARYLLCTTEAMPLSASADDDGAADGPRDVAFVALDEAQLGQDRERGHVFTSRLLHARGREETMILGSGSLAPVIRDLVPEADIIARPRFSTLSYAGPKKITRLPPRTAIVAFSAEEVYAIAEALRRFSGGAAVVMGALSPRTRNAQVAMFQAGEVDFIVATDAIGMGLNLDVSHVAFASLNKFDGVRQRRLTLPEMAQIAGRAGRHQRDGSFGSIGADAAFEPEEIERLEAHRFDPLGWLHWRNPTPATGDVEQLIADLEAPPPSPTLRPSPESSDLAVLRRLSGDADAIALVDGSASVQRLWSACSLPDFRKAGADAHSRFVARLWRDLGSGNGQIDPDWFLGQLKPLDDVTGSVEKLSDRIAAVRTYCYITHRQDWLAEPEAMAAEAQAIETRLSDALHNALTTRFVDRRTTVLMRGLGQGAAALPVAVAEDGTVRVDGEAIGQLDGFAFSVDPATRADDRRMLLAAAEKHLAVELASRASALAAADNRALSLVLADGAPPSLFWQDRAVATLGRGKHRLAPRIQLVPALAALDAHVVAAVTARLGSFVDNGIADHLRSLVAMAARAQDPLATPALRALLAAIVDGGGSVGRDAVGDPLLGLTTQERQEIHRYGVRVGTLDLYCPLLVKPGALRWLAALDAAWRGGAAPPTPAPGIALVAATGDTPPVAVGFRRVNDWWLRVDLLERIARHAHDARKAAQAAADPAKAQPVPAEPAGEDDVVAAEGDGADVASDVAAQAPAPTPAPLPHGGFRVDPEFARSIGLPLADRLAVLRLLGFRTMSPPADVSVAEEAGLVWQWRGRAAAGPDRQRLKFGRRAGDADGERKQSGKGRAVPDKPARAPRKGNFGPDAPPRQRSAPPPPINNPFGALAGLFDAPSGTRPRTKGRGRK